jgi:2,5-dihydroxypyridine 5,6-dioxygenase
MSERNSSELSTVLEKALALSKVQPGERVVLLHPYIGYNARIVEGLRVALNNLDADFVRLELPPRSEGMRQVTPLGPYAVDVLKRAQMVVRVSPRPALTPDISVYHPSFSEILAGGARWLDFMIDEASIWRLFPSPQMIERTLAGALRMEKAKTVRVASDTGTDLTVQKTGRKGAEQSGIAAEPGAWDNWGFGLVCCAPLEDSADGTYVVSPGDSAATIERVAIDRERVVFRFEKGRVVSIEGGAQAELMRMHLESFNDPNVYRIAHIGWGTQEKAVWGGPNFTTADWESFYGCMMLHFGVNIFNTPARHKGLGGKVPAGTHHWGGAVLNHSLWLDDELIVDKGRIVAPDLK